METCNENCKSEHSELSNMENVQKIKFQNQYQLLKSWTLSFCDNVTGHTLVQWKAAYQAIEEYKSLASGVTWDNTKGGNIKDNDPASKAFWEGYTKSPVSSFICHFF